MKQYFTTGNTLITDTYIKLDYVKDLVILGGLEGKNKVSSNISNLKEFIEDLQECESKSPKNRGTSTVYGVLLTFLLDERTTTDKDTLDSFIGRILEKFSNIPYYCYLEQRGKGNYLIFYFCDREYSKDGIITEVKAKSNIYKDSITGRLCKKDDKNAVLVKNKGDILAVRTSKFTSKKRLFNFTNTKQFNKWLLDLKKWFIDITVEILQVIVDVCPSFKKYVVSKYESRYKKAVAKRYNSILEDLEREYMKRYNYLENTSDELNGEISTKARQKLENLYREVNKKLIVGSNFNIYSRDPVYKVNKNNKVVKQNRGHKTVFKLSVEADTDKVEANIELLKQYFIKKLLNINNEDKLIYD